MSNNKKPINNKELRKFMDNMIVGNWTSKSTIQFSENARQVICQIIQIARIQEDTSPEEFTDKILEILEKEINEGIIPKLPEF